ncbi:hypothetical protein DFH09DRAFT_1078595 [Mycena vulgaris]|nr:hypothetical protein DFH09DRAFT_1078595 [Mycena vulgaris]
MLILPAHAQDLLAVPARLRLFLAATLALTLLAALLVLTIVRAAVAARRRLALPLRAKPVQAQVQEKSAPKSALKPASSWLPLHLSYETLPPPPASSASSPVPHACPVRRPEPALAARPRVETPRMSPSLLVHDARLTWVSFSASDIRVSSTRVDGEDDHESPYLPPPLPFPISRLSLLAARAHALCERQRMSGRISTMGGVPWQVNDERAPRIADALMHAHALNLPRALSPNTYARPIAAPSRSRARAAPSLRRVRTDRLNSKSTQTTKLWSKLIAKTSKFGRGESNPGRRVKFNLGKVPRGVPYTTPNF